jgi:hypothetical protein
MSAREIIEELSRLTAAELHAIERYVSELISREATEEGRFSNGRVLRPERIAGRLVLNGPRIVRQAEVDVILNDFP